MSLSPARRRPTLSRADATAACQASASTRRPRATMKRCRQRIGRKRVGGPASDDERRDARSRRGTPARPWRCRRQPPKAEPSGTTTGAAMTANHSRTSTARLRPVNRRTRNQRRQGGVAPLTCSGACVNTSAEPKQRARRARWRRPPTSAYRFAVRGSDRLRGREGSGGILRLPCRLRERVARAPHRIDRAATCRAWAATPASRSAARAPASPATSRSRPKRSTRIVAVHRQRLEGHRSRSSGTMTRRSRPVRRAAIGSTGRPRATRRAWPIRRRHAGRTFASQRRARRQAWQLIGTAVAAMSGRSRARDGDDRH